MNSQELPRYKCHKEVQALKISAIEIREDGSAVISPAEPQYAPFTTRPDWAKTWHGSEEDKGYYVVYKDGYTSWSPTAAFEEGYTPANQKHNGYDYMAPADAPVFKGLEHIEIVFAKDQPQYNPLRCLRGRGRFVPVLSRWSFTPEQRSAIADGGDVILELSTFGQPLSPIRMAVTHGEIDPDWVRVSLLDMPAMKPEAKQEVPANSQK